MATPKKTGSAPKRSTTATKTKSSATKAAKVPAPTAYAARVKPVRTVPTSAVVHSKTMANGEPRPKSRRGK